MLRMETKELVKRLRLVGAVVKRAPGAAKDERIVRVLLNQRGVDCQYNALHVAQALLMADGKALREALPDVQQRAQQRR